MHDCQVTLGVVTHLSYSVWNPEHPVSATMVNTAQLTQLNYVASKDTDWPQHTLHHPFLIQHPLTC
jgi:hypothetical protein